MGCGKTTLGRALAAEMQVPFIDLDDYIEERCGATIRQIVAQAGMKKFRLIERQALLAVAEDAAGQGAIVSCGGGTPLTPGNMELMNAQGLTIWLTTTPERISSRLCLPQEKVKRPKYAEMPNEQILAAVRQGLQERQPSYEKAQLRFDSTYLESQEQVTGTARQLAALLSQLES